MAVCPTCHAKIHRIRGRYSPEQLRMYKERWVQLCALGLPLDTRIALALDITKPPQGGKMPPGVCAPPEPYFAHPYPLQPNFTGRISERRMLTEWLVKGKEPVFALTAIGGMGKSALAWVWVQRDVMGFPLAGATDEITELADCHVMKESRPDGLFWWSFYEHGAAFPVFLDNALIYASDGSIEPRAVPTAYEKTIALLGLMQQKRLLFILDGFERSLRAYYHLGAAYQGDQFVQDEQGDFRSCPDEHAGLFLRRIASLPLKSRVLLTSRLFPRELDNLAGCRSEALSAMDPQDAVAFFHAQGIHPTSTEVEEVCAPYGYHPLALRLLTGVILNDKRNPGGLEVARKHQMLRELQGKEHHHILQVAYDTLERQKRLLLSRISAFRNPMTYDAILVFNVWKGEEKLCEALDELVDRGLLLFDRQGGRYDLHPIVRQYSYDRLTGKQGVHALLRDYFSSVPLPGRNRLQNLKDAGPIIELYHHTIRAGRCDDARKLYEERLSHLLYFRFGAFHTCIELLEGLFPEGIDNPPNLEKAGHQAWTLNELANSFALTGRLRRASRLFEKQNELRKQIDDHRNIGIGLANLAIMVEIPLGRLESAHSNVRSAIKVFQDIGERTWEATGRMEKGLLLAYQGEFEESERELALARLEYDRIGPNRTNYVTVVRNCDVLRNVLGGKIEEALEGARKARKVADEVTKGYGAYERDLVRCEWLLGLSMVRLAEKDVLKRKDNMQEAETHLGEALTRCRRIGLIELEPDILLAWARLRWENENPVEARALADEALARIIHESSGEG